MYLYEFTIDTPFYTMKCKKKALSLNHLKALIKKDLGILTDNIEILKSTQVKNDYMDEVKKDLKEEGYL